MKTLLATVVDNWLSSIFRYIDKIADRFDVTIDYLIQGGEIKSDSLTSQKTELMDNYRKLTDEGRKIALANVKLLSERFNRTEVR